MTRPPDVLDPDDGVARNMERLIASMRERVANPSTTPGSGPFEGSTSTIRYGARLGDFHLERRLGVGAMGEVFAATRESSSERVALKVLRIASPTRLYRFKREFRALADITHPNLIGLRELFVPVDGPAFFTMELVEGESFTTYVRGAIPRGSLPNLERLQAALVQLVRGVHHLHHARCIHRDLKPSNVLVTPEGRVVILDFGLVSEQVGEDTGITGDGQLLGTPAYMAPEQADSETSPAVDYYAVGVMLYECLTGSLPFSGAPMKIILLKQDGEAPDPAASGLAVPVHLRKLCMRLLQRDPARRPTGREILEQLDGYGGPSGARGPRTLRDSRMPRHVPFVGRELEQGVLENALHEVMDRGASITVHVHGRSGYGKSALVARLLTQARGDERALVLGGRCYERVWVSYKGVDTVVDALSLHLRRMSLEQRAAVRPRHIGALARIFPVLGDIWETAVTEGQPTAGALEPADQRRLGLTALRELLGRLGAKRPLVVLIDDLQWSNLDGVKLLTSIMRPPDPPALLLLLVFRDERADNPGLRALTEPAALEGRDVRELEVGPLPTASALELVRVLAHHGEDEARALEIVRHAGGSPFFIGQLLAEDPSVSPSVETSDRLVVARLADLTPETRRVLTCVGLASGPVPLAVLAELLPRARVQRQIDELSALGLVAVKARELEQGTVELLVETSHNRIREVALAELGATERRELHLELATAFELHNGDPETLAGHYSHGGDREQAAIYTERAAERASETLAFVRSVELYRRTLELLPDEAAERRHRIQRALVRQLVNVGHGAEAATLLLELATKVEPGEARALRREASHQLARSGRVDESIALTAELLRDLGEPAPSTRGAAIVAFLRDRLRLWLRGWKHQLRTEAEVDAEQLERIDTLLTVIDGHQEVMVAMALHARALPLALAVGEPRRLGKALVHEISIQAGMGHYARARELVIEAQELAVLARDAELDVELEMSSVDVDWLSYQYQRAYERLGELLTRVDEGSSVGPVRSRLVVRRVEASLVVGRLAELRRELPRWTASARDQGNRQELASLEAHAAIVALRQDDLSAARRHLAAGRSAWAPTRYTFASAILDNAEIGVLIHEGELQAALACVEAERLALHRAGLDRFHMTVDVLDRLYGQCLVQKLLREPTNAPLAATLRALSRRWLRSKDPAHQGQAHTTQAMLGSLSGDVVAVRKAWRRAHALYEGVGMRAHLAAIRMRLGAVTSVPESRRLTALADAYLRDEGIVARERMVETLAPAAPLAY